MTSIFKLLNESWNQIQGQFKQLSSDRDPDDTSQIVKTDLASFLRKTGFVDGQWIDALTKSVLGFLLVLDNVYNVNEGSINANITNATVGVTGTIDANVVEGAGGDVRIVTITTGLDEHIIQPASGEVIVVTELRFVNNHATLAKTVSIRARGTTDMIIHTTATIAAAGGILNWSELLDALDATIGPFTLTNGSFIFIKWAGTADANGLETKYKFHSLEGITAPTETIS